MDKEFAELNIKTKSINKKIVKKDETSNQKIEKKKKKFHQIPLLTPCLGIFFERIAWDHSRATKIGQKSISKKLVKN